jgi:21S rRNA (GM2251-2'-O)-methyltransferase
MATRAHSLQLPPRLHLTRGYLLIDDLLMLPITRPASVSILRLHLLISETQFVRRISLTGAIERGLRKGQRSLDGRSNDRPRGLRETDRSARTQQIPRNRYGGTESQEESEQYVPAPRILPYTTAASEFIYGTFAVNAAIKAGRRKLYKLYVHSSEDQHDSIGARAIHRRAQEAGLEVIKVGGTAWRQLFDQTSEGRPHNGYILEASRIPTLPVAQLQPCGTRDSPVQVRLGQVALEDDALSTAFQRTGSTASIRAKGKQQRYPILLLLDRVTDLGNLGAILRSAYFFGVNGVVLLDHGTAPLSAITIKASAGAAEVIPIMRIKDETGFIKTSKENGWHFLAAVAPENTPLVNDRVLVPEHDFAEETLQQKPVVLMLGNEGEGLRPRIARMANSTVSIQDAFGKHDAVDSLNVSVAAGILMYDLLRPFLGYHTKTR